MQNANGDERWSPPTTTPRTTTTWIGSWRRSRTRHLVALESALLAIIGTGLGAIVGWVENQIFLRYPIDLSSAVSEDLSVGGFYIELSLQMNLTTFHYLFTLAAVFVGVLLVGVYPAWKAGTVEPVEVLQTI